MKIVYNSFNGRYSDSPAAVHRALLRRGDAHEHVWLCSPERDGGFPAGTVTRPIYTASAVEALESADMVISDSHLEMDWEKRPGATYVQTWHGTPLKRVHADILSPPAGVLERLWLDVDRWDVLLSPNPHGTASLRSAFGWQGPVLEIGLPRNDVLLSAQAAPTRARVRRAFGIGDGQTVVLYTPTFRDDVLAERGPEATTTPELTTGILDGLEDVVVLVRLHYKLTGRAILPEHPAVRDVSAHPDVAELYLAADAMVTDYSSTMFDFAVTGRPLIFYAYDLEHYRDEMRGFYFDLDTRAPGPFLRTQRDLAAQLRDLPALTERYAGQYRRFRDEFCPLDDGRATQRFLDRLIPAPARPR